MQQEICSELKDATILIVDDNPINQKLLVLGLQKHVKGIVLANDGEEAVEKFLSGSYDIIIMDLQMPGMNGIQATKKIRDLEVEKGMKRTPIIGNTAHAFPEERDRCLDAGMDNGFWDTRFNLEMFKKMTTKFFRPAT